MKVVSVVSVVSVVYLGSVGWHSVLHSRLW